MEKKTKVEIINETAAAYNLQTRSTSKGACVYLSEEGRMCAFGRCLTSEGLEFMHLNFETISVSGFKTRLNMKGRMDSFLKEQYRDHPVDFWRDIQYLHDSSLNWTNSGLSEIGETKVEELLKIYKD